VKRRFIQINGELVEVSNDYETAPRGGDYVLWNDRDYQDMGDQRFSSRTKHRRYMRERGVTTADDFKEQWRGDEKRHIEAKRGVDPTRRADIERAIHTVNSKGRK
jgi:hypothetical protein